MDDEEDFSSLHFDFVLKTFFPKFELLNSGCGLSASFYGIFVLTEEVAFTDTILKSVT